MQNPAAARRFFPKCRDLRGFWQNLVENFSQYGQFFQWLGDEIRKKIKFNALTIFTKSFFGVNIVDVFEFISTREGRSRSNGEIMGCSIHGVEL